MIRVAVCDDILQIRRYFEEMISGQADMEFVGAAASGEEIVALACREKPDIILMDIQMETEYAGVTAARKILEENPDIKILMITVHEDDDYIAQSYFAGAVDYIIKTDSREEICAAVRGVYAGQEFVRPGVAKAVIKQLRNVWQTNQSLMYVVNMVSKLTVTEIEILKALYDGKTKKEIAGERFVERDTIKFHVKNILRKMQCQSTKELMKILKELKVFDLI